MQTPPEEYDLVVLGSGEAGKYIAWTQARKGKRAVVIERKYVGGSCPNIACLPSKNLIHSAKVASYFWRSAEFGISKDYTRIDMASVRERKGKMGKRKMVEALVQVHLDNFKASGAELVIGSGRFIGPKTIEAELANGGTRVFRGQNVYSTGSRATIEQIPGLVEANPLTHVEALDLDHIPGHLLIVGGGYIGLELAQPMRRFGSQVTIVERNGRLAHREDQDVTDLLQNIFRDEGIGIAISARTTRVEGKSGDWVKLHATQNGTEIVLDGTHTPGILTHPTIPEGLIPLFTAVPSRSN
jgi:pyruvate/2-oxoglutarate dehydrogenase complex dihydrolipoamide dehydrogenase (E3) component